VVWSLMRSIYYKTYYIYWLQLFHSMHLVHRLHPWLLKGNHFVVEAVNSGGVFL
jgi:hypothetical protein